MTTNAHYRPATDALADLDRLIAIASRYAGRALTREDDAERYLPTTTDVWAYRDARVALYNATIAKATGAQS